jgi:hypothetical protein
MDLLTLRKFNFLWKRKTTDTDLQGLKWEFVVGLKKKTRTRIEAFIDSNWSISTLLGKSLVQDDNKIHAGFDTQSFVQYCMNRDENLNRISHSIFSALSTIPNCRRPVNSSFPATPPLLSYSMVHFLHAVSVVQFPDQATKCQLKPYQRKAEENTIWTHVLIISILRLPSRKVCLST